MAARFILAVVVVAIVAVISPAQCKISVILPRPDSPKTVANWTPPWFCHDIECPTYQVTDRLNDSDSNVEIRRYQRSVWVSTTFNTFSWDYAITQGFQRLFKYISGGNEDNATIPMTAPVWTEVVADSRFKKNVTVSFYVPAAFRAKPPQPLDPELYFTKVPATYYAVLSYPGFNLEPIVGKMLGDLKKALDDYDVSYSTDSFYTAGYDPPFRLKDRHNEVWLQVNATSFGSQ